MNKLNIESYEAYLDDRLEPPGEPYDLNGFFDTAHTFEKHYKGSGDIEVLFDDNKINYSWRAVDDLPRGRGRAGGYREMKEQPESWRELIRAEITSCASGESLDAMEKLPSECRVFFTVEPERLIGGGGYHIKDKVIQLEDRLDKPYMFLVLLQQIGQATAITENADYAWNTGIGLKELIFSGDQLKAELLHSTRSSWAYALWHMRPFISDDPRAILTPKSVDEYVHGALGALSDSIRREYGD